MMALRNGKDGKTVNALRVYGSGVDITDRIHEVRYETEHTVSIEGIRINFEALPKVSVAEAWHIVHSEIIDQGSRQGKSREDVKK